MYDAPTSCPEVAFSACHSEPRNPFLSCIFNLSTRNMAAAAYLISCICNKCETVLCISTNEWIYMPHGLFAYDNAKLFSHPGIQYSERDSPGPVASELPSGVLIARRVCCKTCKAVVGMHCVSTAVGREWLRYEYPISSLPENEFEEKPSDFMCQFSCSTCYETLSSFVSGYG